MDESILDMPLKAIEVTVPVVFTSNGYAHNPQKVTLRFTRDDIRRIESLQRMVKRHKLYNLKIDWSDYELLTEDPDDESPDPGDVEWDVYGLDGQTLIIFSFDRIFFYAQSSYDAAIQFESAEISVSGLKKMFQEFDNLQTLKNP